jgi:hypothetical protein
MAKCQTVYRELAQHVRVESKGPIKSYLGIDVIRNWNQHLIAVNQGAYIDRLVAEYGLINAHIVSTPPEKSLPLLAAVPDEKMCNLEYYQRLTGSLNHLAIFTSDKSTSSQSLVIQTQIGPQIQLTESHSSVIVSWYTADLQSGILTSKQLLLILRPTLNIWLSPTHQRKPSPEYSSFKNSASHRHPS